MSRLRFALITDGSSDAALEYPLRWLLQQNGVKRSIEGGWFDPRAVPQRVESLADRIRAAIEIDESCDLLFVHRDGENVPDPLQKRRQEILAALEYLGADQPPHICVVPIRMTEAWFLHDPVAIRMAVGHPGGRAELQLPPLAQIESLDAKSRLHELMRDATEKRGRRLRGFSEGQIFRRLASLVQDFSPLRKLAAFRAVEVELQAVIRAHGWDR